MRAALLYALTGWRPSVLISLVMLVGFIVIWNEELDKREK